MTNKPCEPLRYSDLPKIVQDRWLARNRNLKRKEWWAIINAGKLYAMNSRDVWFTRVIK